MTLVVAYANPLVIVGDSRVIRDERANRPDAVHPYALKVVLLNPELAIGFAGQVHVANDALAELASDATPNEVRESLSAVAAESSTDFLIATRESSICTISDGIVSDWRPTGHVGSAPAFDRFQRAFHESQDPACTTLSEGEQLITRVGHAMDHACDASSDLGGFLARAVFTNRGLEYQSSFGAVGMAVVPNSTALRRMTAPEGGYTFVVLTPARAGVGALGHYLEQPALGVLYHPRKYSDPQYVPGVSLPEFAGIVARKFDLELVVPCELR